MSRFQHGRNWLNNCTAFVAPAVKFANSRRKSVDGPAAAWILARSLGLAAALSIHVSSRAAAPLPPPVLSADTVWQILETYAGGSMPQPTIPGAKGVPTPAQNQLTAEITQLHQASLIAKAFYTDFPSDSRAAQAHKIEATAALQSVQLGGTQYLPTATALGAAYRASSKYAANDRFDVALTMEAAVTLPTALKGQRLIDNGPVFQGLADKLHSEFGEIDKVYGLYFNIMNLTDQATASNVAQSVMQHPAAPGWAKSAAQNTLNRTSLIGSALNLTLPIGNGKGLDLGALNGSIQGLISKAKGPPTVIYVWSEENGNGQLNALSGITGVPTGTTWIYFCLKANSSLEAAAQSQAPFAGTYSFESAGFDSAEAQYLNVPVTPYVYVLDSSGVVTGSGPVSQLTALLAAATK